MKILAIIPARSGSKGLRDKNTKILHGKPLIAWTIERAQKSKYIERLIVSTDSEGIAEVAVEYGAEVPFIRPAELATDEAPGIAPVMHAIEFLEKHEGYKSDYVLLLQCTSPMRQTFHIDECIELAAQRTSDSIVSVNELEYPILWNRVIDENGFLQNFIEYDEKEGYQRQKIEKVYRLNGSMYISNTEKLKKEKSFLVGNVRPYIMSKESSVDIDDEFGFRVAEMLLKSQLQKEIS